MTQNQFRQTTGIMLILTPLIMITFFTLLQMNFEYPDILREPTDYVLRQFQVGGANLIAQWYGFLFSAVLFVPIVIMLHQILAAENSKWLTMATTIGVLAGAVQVLGLIRWPFLVPYLAEVYTDPVSSQASRDAAVVVFQTFNQYAGVAVGEHLGYLFTSTWTIMIGLVMLKSPLFKSWVSWLGIVSAIGIFIGLFEPLGFTLAADINAISYTVWPVWLLIVGVFLVLARPKVAQPTLVATQS